MFGVFDSEKISPESKVILNALGDVKNDFGYKALILSSENKEACDYANFFNTHGYCPSTCATLEEYSKRCEYIIEIPGWERGKRPEFIKMAHELISLMKEV